MRRWSIVLAAGVCFLFLASSTSQAATIYACKKKIGGTIRVVGASAVCLATETKISWNTIGPRGPQGAPGERGLQGEPGPQGLPGPGLPPTAILLFRQCPPGWAAIDPQPSGATPLVACEQSTAPEPPEPLGFGTISGETGYVLADSAMETPSFRSTQIDFGATEFSEADLALIAQRGQLISGNDSGGSSGNAVAFSYDVLARAEGALLAKPGSEISYSEPTGKRTTYLASVDSLRIGVLVARACAFPVGEPYTTVQAQDLLTAKLQDIALSTANVSAEDAWQKQILHVFAYDEQHVQALLEAYDLIDAAIKADTIVYVTRTDGADGLLY